MKVLYLSYNGLTEPLGRRQVIPYMTGLTRRGWRFTAISFEKAETEDETACRQVRAELDAAGIEWVPKRYHKRPSLLATGVDVAVGVATSLRRGRDVALIHARSSVPALMAEAVTRVTGTPWIFDVRGLLAEEYADGGHWPRDGHLFRLTRAVEGRLLRPAPGHVFQTHRIREELAASGDTRGQPTAVIPCAVDLAAFAARSEGRSRVRAALGLGERPVLAYSGSLGSWYRLQEMLDFYDVAARSIEGLAFLIVTPSEAEARARTAGHPRLADIRITRARPEEVPDHLAAADAGLCFLGDHHSKAASSPTKYGEYLAAGLAVVTDRWTGDAARLAAEPAWILIDAFTPAAYEVAARTLKTRLADPLRLREEARALAQRAFALEEAIDRYDRLYRQLVGAPR